MIRVNLLKAKKGRRVEAGDRAFIFMGGALLIGLGALAAVHLTTSAELAKIERANDLTKEDIERLKAELGDYDQIKAQRAELLRQSKTIEELKAGRTGPVFVMRELSEILTPNKGPTFDRVTYEERLRRDPNIGYSASWDPRRVWLETYEETSRKVKIKGAAKSNEDVAEFLKRLQLSVFFSDVTPESTAQVSQRSSAGSVKSVSFNLSAAVTY
jgi:type IV pilus assembly protein PilN